MGRPGGPWRRNTDCSLRHSTFSCLTPILPSLCEPQTHKLMDAWMDWDNPTQRFWQGCQDMGVWYKGSTLTPFKIWLDGTTDSTDMSLSKLREMVKDREDACCSPWGCKESGMTERLNNKIVIQTFTLAFLIFPNNMPDPSPHLIYSTSHCHDILTPKLWQSPPFRVAWKSTEVSNGVKITHESLLFILLLFRRVFTHSPQNNHSRTSLVVQRLRIYHCRGHGFNPWSGKIPHAAGQLSLWASTTELVLPKACAPQQEKPPQREAQAPQLENMQQQRSSEAINK